MAGICTNHVRKSGAGCDHRSVTVNLDGDSITVDTGEAELDAMPWDDAEKREFIRLGLKRLRSLGLALDDAVGRVTNGEEATNVKQYLLLSKDVTKTNIGTSYVNVPPGANGERSLVEFTGCTEFRIVLNSLLPGSGPYAIRIVRDSDDAVLHEATGIPAQAGVERELDTGWLPLPAAASGLALLRLQARSNTNADDPIFRRCVMLVR